MNKTIVFGSDRRGFDYKSKLIKKFQDLNFNIIDVGPFDDQLPYDYPIYGEKVGKIVSSNCGYFGVVICGTGIGISIAANKVKGIRCGMGYSDEVAGWMRKHNNANVIAFGQDYMDYDDVEKRLDIFLNTDFLGDYHISRINQIDDIENCKPIFQGEIIDSSWKK